MVKAKKFTKTKEFIGLPKLCDFELTEEELPDLKDGGRCQHLCSVFDNVYYKNTLYRFYQKLL